MKSEVITKGIVDAVLALPQVPKVTTSRKKRPYESSDKISQVLAHATSNEGGYFRNSFRISFLAAILTLIIIVSGSWFHKTVAEF